MSRTLTDDVAINIHGHLFVLLMNKVSEEEISQIRIHVNYISSNNQKVRSAPIQTSYIVRFQIRMSPKYPLFVVLGDLMARSYGRNLKTRGPLTLQLRKDKDSPLLKSCKCFCRSSPAMVNPP